MEELFKKDCAAVSCSNNHAVAVGTHGHLYVWGSSAGNYQALYNEDNSSESSDQSLINIEEFCGKLGFSDTTIKTIKKPAFYSLRHPVYEIRTSQVSCGLNFTAVVATEKMNNWDSLNQQSENYFTREIEEFLPELPPKSYNIPDEDYLKIVTANKLRKEIENYLKKNSLTFMDLFKSKTIKLSSFLNIMQNIIQSVIPSEDLKEFIKFKKMKLPGDGISLKPLYELIVKCHQGRGVLYMMGRKDEILPKHGDKLQYNPIKHDTLLYYLIDLPESVSVSKVSCGENFVIILSHSGNVYSWGSVCSPALGKNRTMTFLQIKPISELGHDSVKIIDIACGSFHCLALNTCGVVYTWGDGTCGKLGNGRQESSFKPEPISVDNADIIYINAGHNSSFCKARSAGFYAWGDISNHRFGIISYNSTDKPMYFNYPFEIVDVAIGLSKCAYVTTSGNLHMSEENEEVPVCLNRKHKALEGVQFYQVSCFGDNFFAVSTRGSMFSWTTSDTSEILARYGEKNIPGEIVSCSQHFVNKDVEELVKVEENIVLEPSRIVTMVSCTEESTLLITDKGEGIATGANALGQLGLVYGDVDDLGEDQEEIHQFLAIPRLGRSFKVCLKQVSCGAFHVLAVNEEQKVLSWGANSFGQLGKGSFSNCEKYPEVIQDLKGEDVIEVAAGFNHSLVLTDGGEVFTFGCAEHGKLGLGKINSSINYASPAKIKSLKEIKQISCGLNHSAVINNEKVIIVWGFGWNGQLGCGSKETLFTPTSILIQVDWKDVKCGHKHTVAVSEHGLTYHWGEVSLDKEEPELLTPSKVKGLEDIKIKKVLASDSYSAAVVEMGTQIYMWGRQVYRRIASEKQSEEILSKVQGIPIPLNEKVQDISIGRYHGCLVTDQGKVYTWGYSYNGRVGDPLYMQDEYQKPFDYKPLNLARFLQQENLKGETLKQDLQKLLEEESQQSKEANLREVDQQILTKFNECIDMFLDITDKDHDQQVFFSKCEHKQLTRLQQEPFKCNLVLNNPWGEEVSKRLSGWGALITTYQIHCCFLFKLLSLTLKDERKLEFLNMIYCDMEGDKRMIYTAVYLSRLLLKKTLNNPDLTYPQFVDGNECKIYRELILKILISSTEDMMIFSKIAYETIHQLGTLVNNDEFGIDQDPTHGALKLQSNIKITAYQSNRNIVDRRMSKLKSVMISFTEILKKFIRESSNFSNITYFITKDFLGITSNFFDVNCNNFQNLNDNAISTINTVLKIIIKPLWLALEDPDRFYVLKDVQFLNPENNFKSLAVTVEKFFDGTELGQPGERWLTDINLFLKHTENMEIKKNLLEKILMIGGELEEEYLQALFINSLEPFDKDITVNGASLLALNRITEKNIEKLRVNNPSYDPLGMIIKEISPVPTSRLFGRGENVNLTLFTRSLRQDQSLARCPACEMLVSRDMAPSNYKQVIDIFDPMPPNSSEAILTTILATGPQKQKKGKISDYIKDYQENYSVYLKDFTVIEKVLNLISNVDTLSSATIGIMVDNIEMIDQNTLEADREKMLLKVEENCAFEYHRRIKHSKLQAKISRALDALHSVMQKKLGESRLNDEDLKTLLFNLDYGASNLELERFSDSVMFSIFLNKVREYTNKKDMSLSLFENLTHEMKDALRGFMKRSLNELIKKKVVNDYTLQSPYQARNIVFSFEIDSGFLVIIATNSPSKLNICGRDEFREEEILLYEKMPDQVITEMREELKTAEEPKELKFYLPEKEGPLKIEISTFELIQLIGEMEDRISAYVQNMKLSEKTVVYKPVINEKDDEGKGLETKDRN